MRIGSAGHCGPVRSFRHTSFRQSEIENLDVTALGHEQVSRLDAR